MILLPGLEVYAILNYEIKQVIIYDSLEEGYAGDTLLINNKDIYMKLDSILKYTGFQCDYEPDDTLFKLFRSGKCISIDKEKRELHYGDGIIKIRGIINFEEDIWLPIDPILVYLNARCEAVDGKMVIIAANTTLHEYMSMFFELIESQLCTIQWADNEKLWYYDATVAGTVILDIFFNNKTSSFITGQYNMDRSKSILMSVMDEMDEKLYDDKTGKEVIPLTYDNAEPFYQGLACVSIGNYPNSKYGYINKKGKEVIPLKYDTAWSFYQEFALVELNGKYGYIDKTGKEITPIIYDHAFVVIDGVAVVRHNNKWGIVKFLL
ncbi:MAG: WG repeat-containing protein [Natronincolaceae bacterium]|jgi:hypothetical protein